MMANDWENSTYPIQARLDGQIVSYEVAGIIKSGFGIHEAGGAWNITHLTTGFNCLTAAYFDGAKIVAQYLIENYLPEFERLKITGTMVENYRPLEEKITTDVELAYLKELYGDDGSEVEKKENRMIMRIIS